MTSEGQCDLDYRHPSDRRAYFQAGRPSGLDGDREHTHTHAYIYIYVYIYTNIHTNKQSRPD